MKKATVNIISFITVLSVFCGHARVVVTNKPRTANGGVSLVAEGSKAGSGTSEILNSLNDDEIFMDVGGRDTLRWGLVRKQIEASNIPIPVRMDIDSSQHDKVQDAALAYRLRRLIKAYVRNAVYASAAMKAGVKISADEFCAQREISRKMYEARGKNGDKLIALMNEPESFYEHNLTNVLYARAYSEKILASQIKITPEEIKERIQEQEQQNLNALSTNEFKRVLIADILKKLKDGMDFAEAAEKWSDCPTSDTGGVFTDADEKPQQIHSGNVHPKMEEVYKKLSPGELSGVVETPYSWHILKLMKRNPETEGEEESVELAHVMVEKELIVPSITEEQARKRILNKKLRIELKRLFPTLFEEAKINCKIPLFDGSSKRGKRPKK